MHWIMAKQCISQEHAYAIIILVPKKDEKGQKMVLIEHGNNYFLYYNF